MERPVFFKDEANLSGKNENVESSKIMFPTMRQILDGSTHTSSFATKIKFQGDINE